MIRLNFHALVWSMIVSAVPASDALAAQPTRAQMTLNEDALAAARSGDYDRAVELYEESLELGELNVIYLNLGRALFRAGRCDAAWDAYDEAERAETVDEPPSSLIQQKLDEYREDILESCPAILRTTCAGDGVTVRVGGGDGHPCGMDWRGRPGEYEVVARRGDATASRTAVLRAGQQSELRFDLPAPVSPRPYGLRSVEWFAAGGVLLAAGLVLDGVLIRNFPAYSWNLRTDPGDFIGPGLYALSATAVVFGFLARTP